VKVRLLLLAAMLPLACQPTYSELVVANGDDVSLLHPQMATSTADGRVLQALHAGLTRLDPQTLAPIPGLAASFRSSSDTRTWFFQLRPDLHWSDGWPLEAADFKRSWLQLADPEFGAPYAEWMLGAQIEVQANTLTITFPSPRPSFAEMCAYHTLAPVPNHAPASEVGSGPYRLLERRVRDRVRVERNPFYWDAEHVTIQTIDFLTVESQFTALNLYLAGEVQYVPNVPSLAIPKLLELRPDEFQPTPQFATYFLRFNTTKPPFDQLSARRAYAAAIQAEAMAQSVGGGRAPADGLVPPGVKGWKQASKPGWHVQTDSTAQSNTSSDTLAWPEVEYLYNSSELNRDVAEVLQQQWHQQLGGRVRLANQEWKTFLASQRGLDYQISRSSWVGDYLDPLTFLEIFHSTSGNNRTGWKHPVYDQLIEQARLERQPAARLAVLHEAERLLLDQAPIVPLFYENSFELISPRLHGFERNLRGYVDWGRLRLELAP
jgi:oligopeptide transport system substrate-binding protein